MNEKPPTQNQYFLKTKEMKMTDLNLLMNLLDSKLTMRGITSNLDVTRNKHAQDANTNRMVKLGTVNEKILVTQLDESSNAKIVKKRSINVKMDNSYLKNFLYDPSHENMERLQSLKLKEVLNMYQNSSIRDKQMLESELIKAKSKNDIEIYNVLKTISEYNRFNSPVIKLGDYMNRK